MKEYNLLIKTREFQIINFLYEFKSKKNLVYLIRIKDKSGKETKCVLKDYINKMNSKMKEVHLLKELRAKNLTVPKIYYEGDSFILMEYIEGDTLLDIIELGEENQENSSHDHYIIHSISSVIKWMNDFYETSKRLFNKTIILEDINFRNFIMAQNGIYGIDFEDYRIGYRERDGGRFCAYLLTYNPSFTEWKIHLYKLVIKLMVENHNYDKKLIIESLKEELVYIKERRKIDIQFRIIEEII